MTRRRPRPYRLVLAPLLLAAGLVVAPSGSLPAREPATIALSPAATRVEAEFARIAAATDGQVGVAVRPLDGRKPASTLTLNGGAAFPMASTYKLAVAGALLTQVDAGQASLGEMIAVDPKDFVTSDGISDMLIHPGISLSIANLVELMLTQSDNTATDMLVKRVGGPVAINTWLLEHGLSGLRVDSNTAALLYRAMGITPGPRTYKENVDAAMQADAALRTRDAAGMPNLIFNADVRDTATPVAMVDLLQALASGPLLSPASQGFLLGVMERCHTGKNRLKARLPEGTRIAHKTGSLNGIAADTGVVTLPDGRRFAIAVFVRNDTKGAPERDRIIADVGRIAYDYMLLAAP